MIVIVWQHNCYFLGLGAPQSCKGVVAIYISRRIRIIIRVYLHLEFVTHWVAGGKFNTEPHGSFLSQII